MSFTTHQTRVGTVQLNLKHNSLTTKKIATVSPIKPNNRYQCNSLRGSKSLYTDTTTTNTTTESRRFLSLRCKASKKEEDTSNSNRNKSPASLFSPLSPELVATIDTPLLRIWLPLAVFLGILMLIDAAYSGDWSRIGAISKEQELQLQSIVPVAVGGHAACAVVAGSISKQRGETSWLLRSVKTLAAGFVGLVEVILLPEEKKS